MAIKDILKDLSRPKPRPHPRDINTEDKPYPPPEEPRTKSLPFDTDVPGDRGNHEKQSLVQGSE
jgi:hypothetical protein